MAPQSILLLILVPLIVVGLYFAAPRSHARLGPFWRSRCEGRAWRETFPSASKADIRRFLDLFMDSFALPRSRKLRFAPTDRVLEIYRANSPPGWPDALELETLERELRRAYNVHLRDVWKEGLTLGELFAHVLRPVA